MENAIDMIRADHNAIRTSFAGFSETMEEEERRHLVRELLIDLQTHADLEERLFYPWVVEQGLGESYAEIAEEEHHAVELLVLDLSGLEITHAHLTSKLIVLQEMVDRHIEKEEGVILSFGERAPREALEGLAHQMAERRPQSRIQAEKAIQSRPGSGKTEDNGRRTSEGDGPASGVASQPQAGNASGTGTGEAVGMDPPKAVEGDKVGEASWESFPASDPPPMR